MEEKEIEVNVFDNSQERVKYWSLGMAPFVISIIIVVLVFQLNISGENTVYAMSLFSFLLIGGALSLTIYIIPRNSVLITSLNKIFLKKDGREEEIPIEDISNVYLVKHSGIRKSSHYELILALKTGITYSIDVFPYRFRNTKNVVDFFIQYFNDKKINVEFHNGESR